MEKAKRKNNYVLTALFVLLILPFLSIHAIKGMFRMDMYQTWQTLAMCGLLVLVIVKSWQIRVTWPVVLYVVFELIILVNCVIKTGFSPGIVVSIAASIFLMILLQTDAYYEILTAITVILIVSMIINFPVVLQKMGDENAVFFLGGKNFLGTMLIPGMFLLLLNSLEQHGKFTKLALISAALGFVTILLGSSGTGIVVAASAVLFWFISQKHKPNKALYFGILITIYLLFLVFGDAFFLTDLWVKFTDLLGKDSTLTARTTIWAKVFEMVKADPLFGPGRSTEIHFQNMLERWDSTYDAHNYVMEILLQGGFSALICYCIMFFKTVKGMNMDIEKHRFIFIALFVILINGLTESVNNNFLVIMVVGIACRFAAESKPEPKKIKMVKHGQPT